MNRVFAALVLAFLSPILVLIGLLIVVAMGRPVFFRQERSGRLGVPFRIVKFRTMRMDEPGDIRDADRTTRVGSLLRKTSLDELPSLWNIVCGQMALVGPRPFIASYATAYNAQQARRLEVKPGLTGWAQVKGRNALTWDQKFELDTWYVEHRSWCLDLKILLLTPITLIRPGMVSHPGHETMPLFVADASNDDSGLGRGI